MTCARGVTDCVELYAHKFVRHMHLTLHSTIVTILYERKYVFVQQQCYVGRLKCYKKYMRNLTAITCCLHVCLQANNPYIVASES